MGNGRFGQKLSDKPQCVKASQMQGNQSPRNLCFGFIGMRIIGQARAGHRGSMTSRDPTGSNGSAYGSHTGM